MSFYAKSVSFWPKEWIFKYSDKIMSSKLWSKVTSVFLNINFCAKMSILGKKKIEFREKCWFFQTSVHYYWKWTSYWKTCLFFRKLWLFVWMSIYIKNLSNLIKTSIFLRKCLFVHVLIFIRVFLLLENCYFDSKYDFIRWYFEKSVIFLVKFTFQVA